MDMLGSEDESPDSTLKRTKMQKAEFAGLACQTANVLGNRQTAGVARWLSG